MSWREKHVVLVAEAHTIGALAIIRSLGRAGYPVIACSSEPDAIGFYSNYTCQYNLCPSYKNSTRFISWLKDVIQLHDIKTIIPSEGMLLALRPAFSEFRGLMPLGSDEASVYQGMSKFDLFASFTASRCPDALRLNLPETLLLGENDSLPTQKDLEQMRQPLYAKLDGCHAREGNIGFVKKMTQKSNYLNELKSLRERYRKILLQGHVPGIGIGVFSLRWNGEILAKFMHKRLHEVPHTGGVSSLRCSWRHQRIYEDALARINYLDWQGVSMLEYRWNPQTDRFYLMEMNARFWGSLHLALYSGIDFPLLLVDAFVGCPRRITDFGRNVHCRLTFPKEVEYVNSCLKDPTLPLRKRVWPILEFVLLFFNSKVKDDLLFPGDKKIYWLMLRRLPKRFLRKTLIG